MKNVKTKTSKRKPLHGKAQLRSRPKHREAIEEMSDEVRKVIRRAFDAGWNATKYLVMGQTDEEHQKSIHDQREKAFAEFLEGR